MSGFITLDREGGKELLWRDRKAFCALSYIALHAWWPQEPNPLTGRSHGEALCGDWKRMGLDSAGEYREVIKRLTKYGFATFRTTNRGSIATLTEAGIWQISGVRDDKPGSNRTTNRQQSGNEPTTTKEEEKKQEEKKS